MHAVHYLSYFRVGTIDRDTVLVLASVAYFRNAWKNQFTDTKNASFCLTPSKHIDVEMMHQSGLFRYYQDDRYKFSAVELPYKVYNFCFLLFFLQKKGQLFNINTSYASRIISVTPSTIQRLLLLWTTRQVVSICWSYCRTGRTGWTIWKTRFWRTPKTLLTCRATWPSTKSRWMCRSLSSNPTSAS